MARIYEFGDLTIHHKQEHRAFPWEKDKCPHKQMCYDDNGHIVTCQDCKKQIDPYWAFMSIVQRYAEFAEKLNHRENAVLESEKKNLTLKAAQAVEHAWRSRKMVPTCPHCRMAILPGQGFGGSTYSRESTQQGREAKPMEFSAKMSLVKHEKEIDL